VVTIRLGTQSVIVPVLASPVGRINPAYPSINAPAALQQVDRQFRNIATANLVRTSGQSSQTPQEQAIANAAALWPADRPGAIAGFQRASQEASVDELRDAVILPAGKTWIALFTYGSMAHELDLLRNRPANAQDNIHTGTFDHREVLRAVTAGFSADPVAGGHFTQAAAGDLAQIIGFMEADSRIIDIRWMAYMLATAYWETAHTVVIGRRANGRDIRQWRTMAPIEETGHGAGRNYFLPVKVERISTLEARVTEQDGDQFTVTATGIRALNHGVAGSPATGVPTRAYTGSTGTSLAYFGRGYVQLTWWANYAAAGVSIGRGLDLLYSPQLALDPQIAYALMSYSMMTGAGFANGRALRHYIYGDLCNYAGARALVNANDPQPIIVSAAGIFESALRGARR
jgi:hypothetical protein